MIIHAIILSLQITAIHVLFLDGMLLAPLRIKMANMIDKAFGKAKSRMIQKPLWDCLACMASVWTIILTQSFDIGLILIVCGINALISKILDYEENIGG